MLNTIFQNISVTFCQSILLVKETGELPHPPPKKKEKERPSASR
jgi:hypothetical protein